MPLELAVDTWLMPPRMAVAMIGPPGSTVIADSAPLTTVPASTSEKGTLGAAAVGENSPRAGVEQPLDRPVGVLRGGEVVRPVQQRGDARVERFDRAEQVAGIRVLGPVALAQPGVHAPQVVEQGPVGGDVVKRRLPRVAMGVDESGHHDHPGGVDLLGVPDLEVRPDGDDPVTSSPIVGSTDSTCP